jgi:cyanate lyase
MAAIAHGAHLVGAARAGQARPSYRAHRLRASDPVARAGDVHRIRSRAPVYIDSSLFLTAHVIGTLMNRMEVTERIISAKVSKGIKWEDVARRVGQSKEWTTALCLGQMTASAEQAAILGDIFGLTDEECKWLQVVPYKGSLPTAVPTDPLIYRWYEIVNVYGTTIKELIHEEFGDGIMSAIDFSMDIVREPDPKGDRVNVVLSGKFLPYKPY